MTHMVVNGKAPRRPTKAARAADKDFVEKVEAMATAASGNGAAPAKRTRKPPAAAAARPAAAARKRSPPPPPGAPPAAPAGWYPDPDDQSQRRYWDGADWLGAALPTALVPDGPPTTGEDEPAATPGEIVFSGRTMRVGQPTPEQLTVWNRVAARAQRLGPEPSNDQATDLLERTMGVLESVLEDRDDLRWLEDQFLHRNLRIMDAGRPETPGGEPLEPAIEILTRAVAAFGQAQPAKARPVARRRR